MDAAIRDLGERHVRQSGRGVGGAERGRVLVAEPGLLELATEGQVVVAEDEDPTPGTGPELLHQILVVERSRVGDIAEADDGVIGARPPPRSQRFRVLRPAVRRPPRHGSRMLEAWRNNALRVRARSYAVVGVAPPELAGMPPIPGPDLWVPMAWVEDLAPFGISTLAGPWSQGETRLEHRGYRWMVVKGRLRDGVTVPQADANLDLLMADLAATHPETNTDHTCASSHRNRVGPPRWVALPEGRSAAELTRKRRERPGRRDRP